MKPKYIIYVVMALLALLAVMTQFVDEEGRSRSFGGEPVADSLITRGYPELYRAVFARDAQGIAKFLDHPSEAVRGQAWRALAGTPVDSLDRFIDKTLETGNPLGWFTLSMHEPNDRQLGRLERMWTDADTLRAGLARVLGRQGDAGTLELLLDDMEKHAGTSYEYAYALAVGRLMVNHPVGESMHRKLFEQAFAGDDARITRAYLYGYYRGDEQQLDTKLENALYGAWKNYGMGQSAAVDQYAVRLLGGKAFYETVLYYNSENRLDRETRLAVELSQVLKGLKLDDRNTLAARMLVMHGNPIVAQQALLSLQSLPLEGTDLFPFIRNRLLAEQKLNDRVWLQALDTASRIDSTLAGQYEKRLERIRKENPYFLPDVLGVWSRSDEPEAFVSRLESLIGEGKPLPAMYAVNRLQDFWSQLNEEKKQEYAGKVRRLAFEALALGDRGVAYALGGLLEDPALTREGDYGRITGALSVFELPEDIEVFQSMGGMLRERFPQRAKPYVDSLASLGYAPLNRSLKDAGWEVEVPESTETTFRTPDWERLWQLGRNPVWVLATEKGAVEVEMNPLSAPATVSAIDSLTRAGAYNGIPFHRVVPNFVIQGGDIERRDGFGGPDFIIPTEASEQEYVRGAAGIASAGTDTEGSQYFFMHQWKPHLNGRYTLFGRVTKGMDTVDRIVVGDKVMYAYWK